jgi:hypothetical protein
MEMAHYGIAGTADQTGMIEQAALVCDVLFVDMNGVYPSPAALTKLGEQKMKEESNQEKPAETTTLGALSDFPPYRPSDQIRLTWTDHPLTFVQGKVPLSTIEKVAFQLACSGANHLMDPAAGSGLVLCELAAAYAKMAKKKYPANRTPWIRAAWCAFKTNRLPADLRLQLNDRGHVVGWTLDGVLLDTNAIDGPAFTATASDIHVRVNRMMPVCKADVNDDSTWTNVSGRTAVVISWADTSPKNPISNKMVTMAFQAKAFVFFVCSDKLGLANVASTRVFLELAARHFSLTLPPVFIDGQRIGLVCGRQTQEEYERMRKENPTRYQHSITYDLFKF